MVLWNKMVRRTMIAAALLPVFAIAGVELAARLLPAPDTSLARQTSKLVLDAEESPLRGFLGADGRWRLRADLDDIDQRYLRLLLAYEDRRFYLHNGVDLRAAARALIDGLLAGRVVSGASTLTMQTAKLMRRSGHMSVGAVSREATGRRLSAQWLNKLQDIIAARQLELGHSKRQILEFYLTLAPFGGNLEGVRAASLAYFRKEPRALTLAQSALLVALPQSPEARRPDQTPAAGPSGAKKGRAQVLDRLASSRAIRVGKAALAKEAPLPARADLMFAAPHLAERLARAHLVAGAKPSPPDPIVTYIDPELQARARKLLGAAVARWPSGTAAAGMVVRNGDCAVTAHVGGTDYFSTDAAGQVDLTRAARSPGSTLKPLIYGLAFERALLHPETIITDGPRQFSGYEPRNFDTAYAGEMTVREALIRSVNTTAVAVLERLAPHRLLRRLARVGVDYRVPQDARRLGLAIALGGGSVTLEDLAALYCGLANGGTVRALRWSLADAHLSKAGTPDDVPGAQLLSPGATWAVTDILAGAAAPPGYAGLSGAGGARRIAYKTGTSYGYRDAWAVGYDREHTVAVWLGRPDGAANPKATGWETAAPMLFRLFDVLPAPAGDVAGPAPDGHLMSYAATVLPARLQRFGAVGQTVRARAQAAQPLAVLFPRAGMVVHAPRAVRGAGEQNGTISLTIAGGTPPFNWFIDGKPYRSATSHRSVSWRPGGRGAVALTVFDGRGAQAQANFWLE